MFNTGRSDLGSRGGSALESHYHSACLRSPCSEETLVKASLSVYLSGFHITNHYTSCK